MRRVALSVLMATSMLLAGCFGAGEKLVEEETVEPIWDSYSLVDMIQHEDPRMFMTLDLRTNQTTNTTWAVFDATKGGN